MTDREIRKEGDSLFDFKFLQCTGGKSKHLMLPSVSPGFKWTASAVAGKNAKTPIYILAREELMCVSLDSSSEDSEEEDDIFLDKASTSKVKASKDKASKDKASKDDDTSQNVRKEVILIDCSPSTHQEEPSFYSDYVGLLGDQENKECLSPTPPPMSHNDEEGGLGGITVSCLLQKHRSGCLPSEREEKCLIVVRRRHVWSDTLHQFKCGIDLHWGSNA
ncbi:uncharacterized protein LOC135336724 [Halichondria panicea]|uniref:uncharacterized protein LOC135336724 n=1 Tax=Halichondria panicea TaxID=6063 RepID=UPI00312BC9E8